MATEVFLADAELRSHYFVAPRPGFYKFLWVLSSSNDLVYAKSYSIHRNASSTKIGKALSWSGTIATFGPVNHGDNLAGDLDHTALLGNNHSGLISGFTAQYIIREVVVELDESDEFHAGPLQGSAEEPDYLTALLVHYLGPTPRGTSALQSCGIVAGT